MNRSVESFDLTVPETGEIPVLVEVPHAGLAVPDAVSVELDVPQDGLLRDADLYVDKLYGRATEQGATLLVAKVSRYVVDLNRAEDDVDSATVTDHPSPVGAQPRGVVWRSTTEGRPILTRPLSYRALLARLELYYRPYHQALESNLVRIRERFGHAILVAGHSMPSSGRSLHTDTGIARADVVPGTRGRTTASPKVIDLVDSHFREAGLSVRHDVPYRGGHTTSYYGRPVEHWYAVQIELNRALYLDERTAEPRAGDFEALEKLLDELILKLGRLDL